MERRRLTIKQLAKAAGVQIEAVRRYQRSGLLEEPESPQGRVRRYRQLDILRLQFIQRAQEMGFDLDEIAWLLKLGEQRAKGVAPKTGGRKLGKVRKRLAEIRQLVADIEGLIGT